MKIKLKNSLVLLFLMAISSSLQAKVDVPVLLDRLDTSLSHKQEYEDMKKERLAKLYKLYNETFDTEIKYETSCKLFEEYKVYRCDSAMLYAANSLRLAKELDNAEYIAAAKLDMAFCAISKGVPMEAQEILNTIDRATLPEQLLGEYYRIYSKFWIECVAGMRNDKIHKKYIARALVYEDSLCSVTPQSTPEYWSFLGTRYMHLYQYEEAIKCFNKYLTCKGITTHRRAMVHAELAWAHVWLGQKDKAIEHFVHSAICDNESVTREITALYLLAEHVMEMGYSDRAFKYIHLALDDINFYNANHRKLELGRILPKIEQERLETLKKQKNAMILVGILILLVLIFFVASIVLLRKRNRILRMAEERDRKNIEKLEHLNAQLDEANRIKIEYIGQSFYANAEAVTKMEKLCKSIERQLATRQYDKIKETVSAKRLEAERDNMYAAFDAAFIGLFPNFVEEFNSMFEEKDRYVPENEVSLTTEMRIFALIRLGITNSERIGNFLDYSLHTVNTYKNRIKNKSIVDNEKFEFTVRNVSFLPDSNEKIE